jgi:hypothetical protein
MIQGKVSMKISNHGFPRYLYTGRGLGSFVHNDPPFCNYYNTIILSSQLGIEKEGFHNETIYVNKFLDTGTPDMLIRSVTIVHGAILTAWRYKWIEYLHLRPEAYASRIVKALDPEFTYDVPYFNEIREFAKDTLITELFDKISENNKCKEPFLQMIYNEGSPTHPSCPAGHAVLAGASVTMLKAMLKTNDENDEPLKWNTDKRNTNKVDKSGQTLTELSEEEDPTIVNMTINGELNKLAVNMSYGRMFGGVHYRQDCDIGLEIGEQYAIETLKNICQNHYPSVKQETISFTLEKFDGEIIKI